MAKESNHTTVQATELLRKTRVMMTREKGVKQQFFTDEDRIWLCENLIEAVKENNRLKRRFARHVEHDYDY